MNRICFNFFNIVFTSNFTTEDKILRTKMQSRRPGGTNKSRNLKSEIRQQPIHNAAVYQMEYFGFRILCLRPARRAGLLPFKYWFLFVSWVLGSGSSKGVTFKNGSIEAFISKPLFVYRRIMHVPVWSYLQFLAVDSIRITIDRPGDFSAHKNTIITFYALPNGNTTEQTMGKKIREGDDWHFDIQHIRAQTQFIRQQLKENFVVIYLENNYKSWPAWKQRHPDFKQTIPHIIDSLSSLIEGKQRDLSQWPQRGR